MSIKSHLRNRSVFRIDNNNNNDNDISYSNELIDEDGNYLI